MLIYNICYAIKYKPSIYKTGSIIFISFSSIIVFIYFVNSLQANHIIVQQRKACNKLLL